ncbi:unnamed protein product [Brassica napus]|uniref:(rape) hypothetical protein n=1 Tax=Brassica napus TaxID=3708 RepID=A0A816R3J0_BRANA|nr:unnamed protein product [Brassica napus]
MMMRLISWLLVGQLLSGLLMGKLKLLCVPFPFDFSKTEHTHNPLFLGSVDLVILSPDADPPVVRMMDYRCELS